MTATALREVRLYGRLGREFGRVFRLAVATPAEAARALCAVLPGFRAAFLGPDGHAAYHVFVGRGGQRKAISAEERNDLVASADPIRIVPVIAGAKRQGLGQVILGSVLWAAGAMLELYGAFGGGGPLAVAVGAGLQQVGFSMIVGGVVQMLSPQRKLDSSAPVENGASYGMDAGAFNQTAQGVPVPLAFGRVVVGSAQISAGLATNEAGPPGFVGPIDPRPLPGYMGRFPVDAGLVAQP